MGLVVLLLEGLAASVFAVVLGTAWLLTHPARRTYASAVSRSRPGEPSELTPRREFENWTLQSRGLDLHVWDIRGDLAARSGPTVVFTHGWSDSRISALSRVQALAPFASRMIAWDMAGHGESQGVCTLGTREVEDLLVLIERTHEDGVPLILFGWSLGAGVSIAAAVRAAGSVAGVIAEAPYRLPGTPAHNVLALRELPCRWNLPPALACIGLVSGSGPKFRGFDRAVLAGKLECPLLVIHGSEDVVSPPQDGRDIAGAARQGQFVDVAGGGHAGLWTDPATLEFCTRACGHFLERGVPERAAT